MNNLIMSVTKLVTLSEAAGGLFDFNATLPLEALQFILLTVALTFIFYKPIGRLLEERETLISDNLTEASEKLLTADELCQQYERQLKEAKAEAQGIITQAEREAKEIVAEEIEETRAAAASLIENTNKEMEAEKKVALLMLESKIDELSDLIKKKVLGKVVVP
jgi:F-type H+-transporting ATPase subunit b